MTNHKAKMRKKSTCWDKIYYRSVYDATQKINELREKSKIYDHPYKIYLCPHCKGYHLSQRIDPIYRFLEINEEILPGDTICVVTRGEITHRAKVAIISQRYAFTDVHKYPRVYCTQFRCLDQYDRNMQYKVERQVKQDIQVKKHD